SVIPARRNSVRRCCFTVRGLMLRLPAISLLLHPWARRRNTSPSRGVILTASKLIIPYLVLLGYHQRHEGLHVLRQIFACKCNWTRTNGFRDLEKSTPAALLCSIHFGPIVFPMIRI